MDFYLEWWKGKVPIGIDYILGESMILRIVFSK